MVLRLVWPWAICISIYGSAACGDSAGVGSETSSSVDVADVDGDNGELVEVAAIAYAPCDPATRVGLFSIVLAPDYTAAEGRVLDGVVPANVRVETDAEGACRLVEGRSLFCDPACASDETCGDDGCIPYPTAKSVGVVAVTGLSTALTMTPTAYGSYTNGATSIPHPGFAEGDVLGLVAPGDVLAGFSLEGRGVASLVVAAESVALERDAALAVDWTPGTDPSARLRFVLDLAHHGGIAASLECDGIADSGHFELPARLVTALMDIGLAGFPTLTVSRRTADSTELSEGCVELAVLSEVVLPVTVAGLVSCSDDDACPDGQTCQSDLKCAEVP